jgi:hypothetical protein
MISSFTDAAFGCLDVIDVLSVERKTRSASVGMAAESKLDPARSMTLL